MERTIFMDPRKTLKGKKAYYQNREKPKNSQNCKSVERISIKSREVKPRKRIEETWAKVGEKKKATGKRRLRSN